MALTKLMNVIENTDLSVSRGKVDRVVGLAVESIGPPVKIGEICNIYPMRDQKPVKAEVLGFRDKRMLLMPYDNMAGIGPGSVVESTGMPFTIPVGMGLAGRIIDGLGNPMDDKGPIEAEAYYNIEGRPSNPLFRPRIKEQMTLGVKALDSLVTMGKGQRIGIFAGSGVGKSTLLGMIARDAKADINVIGLVGERGREVRDFIEKDLREEGMKRTVLVVATSDRPAMVRLKCAMVATTVAEYFRDKGLSVMLMMDSLTRFAMAQREIGLATGEPPVSRGYTPSIYAIMPKLLERSGNFDNGSITGIYTVLVEGDDLNEPISDTVRGILDGHIVLSRALAMKNHYPAINVLGSLSRIMPEVTTREHLDLAGRMRNLLATYDDYSDLIGIGAYKQGSSPAVDEAIRYNAPINDFLKQRVDDRLDMAKTLEMMRKVLA
jgi:flagellum-specific ATP synthase